MRFLKGIHYMHPPRGPGRGRYHLSHAAWGARVHNLKRVKRLRSSREIGIIKLLIWQWFFDPEPKPSGRALARQLGVCRSYIWRVARKAHVAGWDALVKCERRITLDDLAEARRFTAKVRDMEPDLLAPAPEPRPSDEPREMTADERIAETRREAAEWKGKNPCDGRPRTW